MIKIGRVTISLEMREVYLEDRLLQVGSRAFDILELLIRAEGKTVTKDEILRHVWPNSVVEENNIHVQLSALRKIFGDDKQAIRTISGRGYRLAIPVEACEPDVPTGAAQPRPEVAAHRHGLPVCHAPLIGRDDAVTDIVRAVNVTPIVTLLGPGGVGKTQLAIMAAKSIAVTANREVCFVALDDVAAAHGVVAAIADALGVAQHSEAIGLADVAAVVRGRRLLILLDTCEHVIESVATVCERLVEASAELRILSTSREPLRTRNEKFYWVTPLDTPQVDASLPSILACGSVRMFLAQLTALGIPVEHDRVSVDMVATICRRLDGVPLALELAAARAAVFGIHKLLSELDDRFQFLKGGRRTAPPRQQTLEASLDWGYRLLNTTERRVLHRLGIFPGRFSLDAACTAIACQRLSCSEVTEAIVGLTSRCFVMTTFDNKAREYFLLETTRDYAIRKLYESDDTGKALGERTGVQAPADEPSHGRARTAARAGDPLVAALAATR